MLSLDVYDKPPVEVLGRKTKTNKNKPKKKKKDNEKGGPGRFGWVAIYDCGMTG